MSFFWTSATYNYYVNIGAKPSLGLSVEHYFLYTKDIQNTNGGTIGSNSVTTKPDRLADNLIHADTVRYGSQRSWLGGDEDVDWTIIAEFPKPGAPLTIIRIWVQGIISRTAAGEGCAGKEMLIPLNTGPGYLATRPSDDYISTSSLRRNFSPVKGGVHASYGYVENNIIQPSEQNHVPFAATDATGFPGKSLIWVYTQTGSYLMNNLTRPIYFDDGGGTAGGTLDFAFPIEGMQQMEVPNALAAKTVSVGENYDIYTGGDITIYAVLSQLDTYTFPEPDYVEAKLGLSTVYINWTTMTLENTVNVSGRNYYLYRLTATPARSIGDRLVNSPLLIRSFVNPLEFDPNWENTIVEETKASLFDPWEMFQMPPHYTCTTTDNRCVIGGYWIQ